jgi:hypothetical protein
MTGVLIREVETTREEFLRRLAGATENRTTELEGDTVTIDGGRIKVRMASKERPGKGAPLLVADFTFDTMSDEEVRLFMETFDRAGETLESQKSPTKSRP